VSRFAQPQHTDEERRNLQVVERWTELYNTDVAQMVRECYAPDCIVEVKGGISWQGHEVFLAVEAGVERVAPGRRGELLHAIAAGDRVVVQAILTDPGQGPDWKAPYCVVLTMRDGLIVHDESYLDLRVWPSPKLSRQEWESLTLLPR
jgi:ketosteroid isomerase-like protein